MLNQLISCLSSEKGQKMGKDVDQFFLNWLIVAVQLQRSQNQVCVLKEASVGPHVGSGSSGEASSRPTGSGAASCQIRSELIQTETSPAHALRS